MKPFYEDSGVTLYHGDCIEVMRTLPDGSVHAVLTDPPYGLEFMGKGWDGADGFRRSLNEADAGRDSVFGRTSAKGPEYNTGRGVRVAAERASELTAKGKGHATSAGPYLASGVDSIRVAGVPFQEWCEVWATEALRILKPGGHLLAFGGSRTWHRLASAVEDAGFEIRDSIAWLYGSGFPKSLDVSKAIDKAAGHWRGKAGDPKSENGSMSGANYERTEKGDPVTAAAAAAAGWGTALKPGFEPIVVGRKPLAGTVAATFMEHGTGALNIDRSRVAMSEADAQAINAKHAGMDPEAYERPAGVSLNLSVNPMPLKLAAAHELGRWPTNVVLTHSAACGESTCEADCPVGQLGESARYYPTFRYEAKAPGTERPDVDGTEHPTVKPLALMRWLVGLVASPGATILEPFAGSGTTLEACLIEGFAVIGIEREDSYLPLIMQRIRKPLQQSLFGDIS